MNVKQYVMAYQVEQDRLRALLPDGFSSLRPVLRINAEIIDNKTAYIEFNTAVEKDGNRGWLNIGHWGNVNFKKNGKTICFNTDILEISFTAVGVTGSCPAEKDNNGCYFLASNELRPAEAITVNKEFCHCEFSWHNGADGKSLGKTLPAIPTDIKNVYPKIEFTVENAIKIPCEQVLGAYVVEFKREE